MITQQVQAEQIRDRLIESIDRAVARFGGTTAIAPGHMSPWHWPPRAPSLEFNVLPGQFQESELIVIDGERFPTKIAETPYGVFGRVDRLWHEARAQTVEEVREKLIHMADPWVLRRHQIGSLIEQPGRFDGLISELEPLQLLQLLYAADRSIGHEAITVIESHSNPHLFGPSLVAILEDRRHPMRRAAQWAVLDMFEDLPSFCASSAQMTASIEAMRGLIWDAEDDYARAIYKAGVVLGGHVCTLEAAEALLACFSAPSRIGRRAAYHASFHLAEWMPEQRERIVAMLTEASTADPEPVLREYCAAMSRDVAAGDTDHVADPFFPEEG